VERSSGETWLSVEEAAERLGIGTDSLHLRIKFGHIPVRGIAAGRSGQHIPHIREADVDRFAREGLPHPDLEDRIAGRVIAVPDEWLVLSRPSSAYGPSGFVATRPMLFGRQRRPLLPGDLLAADDGPVPEDLIQDGDVAELPLRFGVLGLLAAFRSRIERLEAELAEART